jgi:hypothetical protein
MEKQTNPPYRALAATEIDILERQGCSGQLHRIFVKAGFDARFVKQVHFSGENYLGANSCTITFPGGVEKQCGIYQASLHNCTVGDRVFINQVHNYLANYHIEDDVVIENIECCTIDSPTSFGNGTKVAVLDETGGRQVMIYDKLSAHLAYVMAFYKHRQKMVNELEAMISAYSESLKADYGLIGHHSKIRNCRQIVNMKIGPYSQVDGAIRLKNGTLNSNEFAPVVIGQATIAENFIASSGSEISDGAIVSNCFVGQGCILGKQYSAENSLFFANCQGFHGEACSVFGGPYTVTHHKSTLLIAGMFSFCNAGSGSNQSNHMYKLGPIHHGIVERGSKTTSDSYILWPAKIGAFTLVMGRHYKNTDTSDLPFSYLIENKDESWIAPGVNLRSVGTIRDVMKWPKRDRRNDPEKLDSVNFNLLSPFTIQKMLKGCEILSNLRQVSGETTDVFAYHNTRISKNSLTRGLDLYEKAIYKFLGNSVISRIEKCDVPDFQEMLSSLKPKHEIGLGEWSDLSGLIAPKKEINRILKSIEMQEFESLAEVESAFKKLHTNYYDYEWTWAANLLEERTGKKIEDLSVSDLILLIEKWKDSVVSLDRMLYDDAKKEFRLDAMTGFGTDGNKATQKLDFENVRGSFENNAFIQEIVDHIRRKTELGDKIVAKLISINTTNKENNAINYSTGL